MDEDEVFDVLAGLGARVVDFGQVAIAAERGEVTLTVMATALKVCRDQVRELQVAVAMIESAVGDTMEKHETTITGVGTLVRHANKSRVAWDTDSLRRAVLDSRIVDPETGEVQDESPLDRVLHVWNLGAPRVTALRARGIDPDEFCETKRKEGWKVEVQS